MTTRTTTSDGSGDRTPIVRLVSDDPAIEALERSLDALARDDRAQLSTAAMERMVAQVTRTASTHAASQRESAPRTTRGRMPVAMAAMLTLGAMGAAAALLGQRTPPQATQPALAQRDATPAMQAALPTDAEWDLVDAMLTLANTTSDTPSDVWNDAQTLQQQWSEGTWYDDHTTDSAS